jgi:hypothetical protein
MISKLHSKFDLVRNSADGQREFLCVAPNSILAMSLSSDLMLGIFS